MDEPAGLIRADYAEPSVFQPAAVLAAARRQRARAAEPVPAVVLLDPDGDVVRGVQRAGRARRSRSWACYHTELWETETAGPRLGIVGNAVGAPFAVLVAEQLFASGCAFVVSVTSAGRLAPTLALPATILVTHAARGEGTSFAYLPPLPPSPAVAGDPALLAAVAAELARAGLTAIPGGVWTTDAPFRETRALLTAAAADGLLAIEMESAGLYAFAQASARPVVCFALVTNQLAQADTDFAKGADQGVGHALALATVAARGWRSARFGSPRPAAAGAR